MQCLKFRSHQQYHSTAQSLMLYDVLIYLKCTKQEQYTGKEILIPLLNKFEYGERFISERRVLGGGSLWWIDSPLNRVSVIHLEGTGRI